MNKFIIYFFVTLISILSFNIVAYSDTKVPQICTNVFADISKKADIIASKIYAGDIKAVSEFNSDVNDWFSKNYDEILKCANKLSIPDEVILKGYARHLIILKPKKYEIYLHRMSPGGFTGVHNHKHSYGYVIPITTGMIEHNYIHDVKNVQDYNRKVHLYPMQSSLLTKGDVEFIQPGQILIHKVTNDTDKVQSFIEIYFPDPQKIGFYIPYWNEENKFLQVEHTEPNIPYWQSLLKESNRKIVDMKTLQNDFTVFTSTCNVITDRAIVTNFCKTNSCNNLYHIKDKTYVLTVKSANNM